MPAFRLVTGSFFSQLAEITRKALDMDVMEQEEALDAAGARRTSRKNRKKVRSASTSQVQPPFFFRCSYTDDNANAMFQSYLSKLFKKETG